jgi:hypothetical protein
MKHLFTFLVLIIGFSINAQISTNSTNNSGLDASAIGKSTNATGLYSTAIGIFTTASGDFSVAMSYQSVAAGLASTAIGWETRANALASTALGYSTITNGEYSTAMGWNTSADGKLSTAIGYETTASDYGSLVIGRYNLAGATVTNSSTEFNTANTAFVIGNGTVGADFMDPPILSDAFKVLFNGDATVSNDLTVSGDNIVIGNLSAFGGSHSQRSAIDVVAHSDGDLLTGYSSGSTGDKFNIELDSGNSLAKISSGGGYDLTLSTEGGTMNFENSGMSTGTFAFEGNITASNNLTVSGDVVVSSDARLKANIVSLGSTLAKLLLIDGKSYTMKKDGKQKIGVLAQDIQKVFPELVSEDNNEMLAVNYQGLVPVLINALKEQDGKMKEQDDKISRLEVLVEKLMSDKKQ